MGPENNKHPNDVAVTYNAAARSALEILGLELGVSLTEQELELPGGRKVKVDGVSPDRSVLAEVFARPTAPKGGAIGKVTRDALKLATLSSHLRTKPDLYLVFVTQEASKPFLPESGKWEAAALQHFGIRIRTVQARPEMLELLRAKAAGAKTMPVGLRLSSDKTDSDLLQNP
jgi:hypothetical protein